MDKELIELEEELYNLYKKWNSRGATTPAIIHKMICRAIPIIQRAEREENAKLRILLWQGHACEGKYGDDGELQCNRIPHFIDFKRDSVAELERKCAIHNLERQGIAIPEFLLVPKGETNDKPTD